MSEYSNTMDKGVDFDPMHLLRSLNPNTGNDFVTQAFNRRNDILSTVWESHGLPEYIEESQSIKENKSLIMPF